MPGELRWPVPSLSLRDPAHPVSAERLSRFEAVRLFVERARSQEPAFALTDKSAQAVAEVCRRLEGVPLAIELAASRIGTLTVEQLAARADDSLRLLTGESRTAESRQQTLRATLDWSMNMLSEPERKLFDRLNELPTCGERRRLSVKPSARRCPQPNAPIVSGT